ncbi:MAG: DUF4437 domain-containing protein [Neoaquamicrobium sediminum]|uniref:DUF4437 domain-containing protein n=1 Tax=Neoaquamicrobium sediminum TaxID=1849104 RepID=UPI0040364A40
MQWNSIEGSIAALLVFISPALAIDNTVFPASQLPFVFEAPNQPQQLAPLWGTRSTGPAGTLLKFPGGVVAPVHSHTADYRAVVIKGTWKHWVQGNADGRGPELNPGAYWTQQADQMHADACVSQSECVILIINEAPYATHPAN